MASATHGTWQGRRLSGARPLCLGAERILKLLLLFCEMHGPCAWGLSEAALGETDPAFARPLSLGAEPTSGDAAPSQT